jgi:hypothetical protein
MGYDWAPPAMPASVKAARVLLYALAGLALVLLSAVSIAGFSAGEIGALAGAPVLLGLAGAVLAAGLGPGRMQVRIGIVVVEAVWTLLAIGGVGQGDPTGLVTAVLTVAVLVLVNTRAARAYLHRSARPV